MKNKILIGVSLALLLSIGWWASRSSGTGVEALTPEHSASESSSGTEAVMEGPGFGRNGTLEPEPEVREALVDTEPAAADETGDAWVGELGGVVGRILEEDGSAVVGISVAFVQVDANLMLAADLAEMGGKPAELILERTRTDDEGRFRLNGAYDGSFQGLGIDLRGPRCTLRVVDTQIHHREVTDLGDIVLRAGCTIIGRVTDEGGTPVEGVRVRLAPVLADEVDAVIPIEIQDFRSDCAVGISQYVNDGSHSPVVEPPPLIRRHLDDLPLPTTITDVDGAYRFEGAPIGDVLIGIDKRGWLGMLRRDTTEPGEVELSDAILRTGRSIRGEVIDTEGDPVAGVEVMAGTEIAGVAAILQPAGVTDGNGHFSVDGCPLLGNTMACARRAPNEPWTGVVGAGGEDLEIELETVFDVSVRLLDLGGKPVTNARVTLEPGFEDGSAMVWMMRFALLGNERRPSRFKETEPGLYICSDVTPGMYEVRARPEDLNAVRRTVELWPGKPELTLVCEPGRFIDVTVVDHVTGKPVPHARASVIQPGSDLFFALAAGSTDSTGAVRLGPCTSRTDESRNERDGEIQVLVQHPRYADAAAVLHDGVPSIEVRLFPGGEVSGRVVWGAEPPRQVYMLVLVRQDGAEQSSAVRSAFLPPRLGRTGLDGSFRFSNLRSGTYDLELFERWLGGDPIDLALKDMQPVLVHRQEGLIVESGIPLDLVIDLGPVGAGDTARVAGVVRIDGEPVEGATVRVHGSGGQATGSTDADGRYETTPFLVKASTSVMVWSEVDSEKRQLYSGTIDPMVGEVYRLDVDVNSAEVRVRVTRSEDGQPVNDAKVSLALKRDTSKRSAGRTDEEGYVTLIVLGDGSCEVSARAPGRIQTSREYSFESRDVGATFEIELPASVPCAGRVDLTSRNYGNSSRAFMRVTGDGTSQFVHLDASDVSDDGQAAFEVEGIGAGTYEASFYIDGDWSERVSFEVPEGGATDLLLVQP